MIPPLCVEVLLVFLHPNSNHLLVDCPVWSTWAQACSLSIGSNSGKRGGIRLLLFIGMNWQCELVKAA
eukprot:4409867-Amphidinium_carterae.1